METNLEPVSLQDRFLGCILGQAVGDSIGAPFEGLPADFVFWQWGSIPDILDKPFLETLKYTDDTQMMITVAESLIASGTIIPKELLNRFADLYDPERGYGPGARKILEAVLDGTYSDELVSDLFPGGSYGNGAAMRAAPIGLLFADDIPRLLEEAERSAVTTHRHPWGIEGARLIALATALAMHGPPFRRKWFYQTLIKYCREEEFQWQLQAASKLRDSHSLSFLGSSLPAHKSVVTAIACFTTCPKSFNRCIEKAISLGDDTDTLAAMAGAIAGAHLGIQAVPALWVESLEGGRKGREYLRDLALRLQGCVPENKSDPKA